MLRSTFDTSLNISLKPPQNHSELHEPDEESGRAGGYLDDRLGEVHPPAQEPAEIVPLLLQGPQVRLQLGLGLLVPHGEELPADLQGVDEGALVPLEQQLCVLRGVGGKVRDELSEERGSRETWEEDIKIESDQLVVLLWFKWEIELKAHWLLLLPRHQQAEEKGFFCLLYLHSQSV